MALARHQFPPAIVQHAVRLYVRCTLSYRDVEDLLVELPLQEQLGENSRTRKGEISELDERLTPNEFPTGLALAAGRDPEVRFGRQLSSPPAPDARPAAGAA